MSNNKTQAEIDMSANDLLMEDVAISIGSVPIENFSEDVTNQYLLEEELSDFFVRTMGEINRIKSYAKPIAAVEGVPSEQGVEKVDTYRQQVWFTPLLIVMTFTLGMLLTRRFKLYIQDVKAFFYMTNLTTNVSDSRMGLFQFRFMTFSVSALSVTLFCCFILEDMLKYSPESFLFSFLRLLSAVLLYVFVKLLLNRIMCYVFFDRARLESINKHYFTLITFFGFSLFFVVLLIAYGQGIIINIALWIGIILCCLAVIFYLYKIFEFFFTGVSSLFYLILYLCTLEILPTVVFVWGLIISV